MQREPYPNSENRLEEDFEITLRNHKDDALIETYILRSSPVSL